MANRNDRPPKVPKKTPPVDFDTHLKIHQDLDTLEEAVGLAATTIPKLQILEQRLIAMQEIAEQIAEEPGTVEDREVACAKIELFAQQLDVIAQKPEFKRQKPLEGGTFRFPLVSGLEDLPANIEIEIPNLRARGEGSLGMFEHVDGMFAHLSDGRFKAAFETTPHYVDEDDEYDEDDERPEPPILAEGKYIIELNVLNPDASDVLMRLLPAEGGPPVLALNIDMSMDAETVDVDIGLGLAFIVDRIAKTEEISVGTQFIQTLDWRRESGERLESVEGWFHETTQARDFELYALYLESPLQAVRKAKEVISGFQEEAWTVTEKVLERVSRSPDPAQVVAEELIRTGKGWNVLESEKLLNLLVVEEQAHA